MTDTHSTPRHKGRFPSLPISLSEKDIVRFWQKVLRTDLCWRWTGMVDPAGYGRFTVAPTALMAHRIAWSLCVGPIPGNMWVLHRCDVPPCVNPSHLFLGTCVDNVLDMRSKGRGSNPRGEAHGQAKLTEKDVLEIRRLLKSGMIQREVGMRYGVTRGAIRGIVRGRNWAWLQDDTLIGGSDDTD